MKKLLIFFTAFLFFIPFITVKANDEMLVVTVTKDGQLNKTIDITNKSIKLVYDPRNYNVLFLTIDDEYIDEVIVGNNESVVFTFSGVDQMLLFNDLDSSYGETFKKITPDDLSFKVINLTYLLMLGEEIMDNDSSDVCYYIFWGLKEGVDTSDIIVNDVTNPYSINEIKKEIRLMVIDEHDGNLSNVVFVEEDTYSDNMDKVGVFHITFGVINKSNILSTYKINIYNHYYGRPTISGNKNLYFHYDEEISLELILSDYTVSDLYDENPSLVIESNNVLEGVVGEYYIDLLATNKTGATTTFKVFLEVYDSVAPVFNDLHEGVIKFNYKELPSNEQLLLNLEAFDAHDLDVTHKIVITKRSYSDRVGKYNVYYEVEDSSGNKATHQREYEIYSTDAPIFYVSKNLLTIEDINELSIEQIVQIIFKTNEIEYDSYEVLTNTYSNNSSKAGTYEITLKVNKDLDEQIITYQINVFSDKTPSHLLTFILTIVISVSLLSIFGYRQYKKK